jgi:hypothetical protein
VAETPARAKLIELDADFQKKADGKTANVQFNPESLKVTYANQLSQPGGGGKREAAGAGQAGKSGDQAGGAARQFLGTSTTKLSMTLWFDVTGLRGGDAADATKLTAPVRYFITPRALGKGKELLPPNVRFEWGSFFFDGTFDSLEESFEYFSEDGRPLRAQLSLTMSRQEIKLDYTKEGAGFTAGSPGQNPLSTAVSGATLQGLAAGAGGTGAGWQAIAAGNGIEDPLRLAPGQLVDLGARGAR